MATDGQINGSWSQIGGALVPHNTIESQSTRFDRDGNKRFIIKFKDKTTVDYPQQNRNAKIFTSSEVTNLDGAIITGSDNNDRIVLNNCQGTQVSTRNGSGRDVVVDNNGKGNTIFLKKGDQFRTGNNAISTYYDFIPEDATFINGQSLNSNIRYTEKYTK